MKNSIHADYHHPTITDPGPHDVLFGRGGAINSHAGNILFRRIVNEQKEDYHSAPKNGKPKIAHRVVSIVRNLNPAGRFLAPIEESAKNCHIKDTVLWYDVGDKKARAKASQCLREKIKQESYHHDHKCTEDMNSRHSWDNSSPSTQNGRHSSDEYGWRYRGASTQRQSTDSFFEEDIAIQNSTIKKKDHFCQLPPLQSKSNVVSDHCPVVQSHYSSLAAHQKYGDYFPEHTTSTENISKEVRMDSSDRTGTVEVPDALEPLDYLYSPSSAMDIEHTESQKCSISQQDNSVQNIDVGQLPVGSDSWSWEPLDFCSLDSKRDFAEDGVLPISGLENLCHEGQSPNLSSQRVVKQEEAVFSTEPKQVVKQEDTDNYVFTPLVRASSWGSDKTVAMSELTDQSSSENDPFKL